MAKKEDSNKQAKKKLNLFGIISELGQLVLIVVLIGVAIASFGTRIPFLAERGMNFFAVTSGSMEPNIPVGAILKAGQYKLEDLKEGDVLTYQFVKEDGSKPSIVTHRISKIDKKEEVKLIGEGENQIEKTVIEYEIKTKGDANNAEDQYTVKPNNIIGKYEWHVPYIGYVTAFSQTPTGFISLVIVPAIILIIWEVISLVMHFKNQYAVKSEKEIEKLKKELALEKAKSQ